MCVDFTNLNKSYPKDWYLLPRIDQFVHLMSGQSTLSFLNAFSGYHQVFLKEEDLPKCAFITNDGVKAVQKIKLQGEQEELDEGGSQRPKVDLLTLCLLVLKTFYGIKKHVECEVRINFPDQVLGFFSTVNKALAVGSEPNFVHLDHIGSFLSNRLLFLKQQALLLRGPCNFILLEGLEDLSMRGHLRLMGRELIHRSSFSIRLLGPVLGHLEKIVQFEKAPAMALSVCIVEGLGFLIILELNL
ncbi:hypothetical protein vseg_015239 [Gypsophila vaccaria]